MRPARAIVIGGVRYLRSRASAMDKYRERVRRYWALPWHQRKKHDRPRPPGRRR